MKPALFSPNSAGACPNCNGAGVIDTDLGVDGRRRRSSARSARGARFDTSVLEHTFGGRDIADVLAMSVAEAERFFAGGDTKVPAAHRVLERLDDGRTWDTCASASRSRRCPAASASA
ncbi:MAG: hypothetical protein V9E94_18950 [Microthrixaceae bacterium]